MAAAAVLAVAWPLAAGLEPAAAAYNTDSKTAFLMFTRIGGATVTCRVDAQTAHDTSTTEASAYLYSRRSDLVFAPECRANHENVVTYTDDSGHLVSFTTFAFSTDESRIFVQHMRSNLQITHRLSFTDCQSGCDITVQTSTK